MNLKGIKLCERNQNWKVIYYTIPFIWHSLKGKSIGIENKTVVSKGWVCQGGGCWLQRSSMKEFWGLIELFCVLFVVLVTKIYICIKTQNCTQKLFLVTKMIMMKSFKTRQLTPILCSLYFVWEHECELWLWQHGC